MNEDVNIFIKPMERKAFSEIPSPKLVSDWKGLTIVTKQMMTSGIITIEKGTIMKVQSAGKRLCLVGDLCQCCGIKQIGRASCRERV